MLRSTQDINFNKNLIKELKMSLISKHYSLFKLISEKNNRIIDNECDSELTFYIFLLLLTLLSLFTKTHNLAIFLTSRQFHQR
jgi:hypothetical protein